MGLAGPAAHAIQSLSPNAPVNDVQTMGGLASASVAPRRLALALAFAALAPILAAVGIYGVTFYAVARATHDLGPQMALGAQRREVIGLVLRHGLRLAAAGAVAGRAGACPADLRDPPARLGLCPFWR